MGQRMTGQKADSRTFWGRHYAWVITALCMLMMCVGMGLNANTFFLYEPYLMRAFDFTNTQNSLINTARALPLCCFSGTRRRKWDCFPMGRRRPQAPRARRKAAAQKRKRIAEKRAEAAAEKRQNRQDLIEDRFILSGAEGMKHF